MKNILILTTIVCLGVASSARAQGAAAGTAATNDAYIEFVTGPTFGHNTSVMFGGEAGVSLGPVQVFVEGGTMRDIGTADLDEAAGVITDYLQQFGAATSTAKQPVGYLALGLRYNLFAQRRLSPYASMAIGGARVTKDTTFFVDGVDITDVLLENYGVQLGEDLAGSQTSAYLEFGGGISASVTGRVIADVSYRYGRVFQDNQGLNTSRLQFGIGVGF